LQVLPLLDNLELALKAVSKEQKNTEFVQGIELIHAQLLQLLQHNNVFPIETTGKDFDPYYHEALVKMPAEVPANKIIEEFQRGFTIHGRVLRHAKVKISAGPAAGNAGNTDIKNNDKKTTDFGGN
ncbi:MAG: nucleotide exchange factor GrpE, partial [Nanoarchaeota archaeon]